ncbi:cytochrome c4 [Pseudomonas sp. RIT-PI-AD]|uniref:c-type cytochrome n=1 Tax=Pseudomonas sp. RIT-PI-AD TaxID=3035294 RepID=UPI0021D83E3D|nr:cytochrome c4 [Pseudomonas sp. RIT-PI-AD]
MNKLLVSLLLSLGISGLGIAGSANAADGAIVGDAAAGQGKAAVCGACHGPDGNSPAPNFPKLAGQGPRYLLKQLKDIKAGNAPTAKPGEGRKVLEMTGLLDNLSDQDLADIVAYFSSQKMGVGAADPKLVKHGEELFRGGKLAQGMPACTGCHSPNGAGNAAAGFPQLGGQHATYVAKQLTDFREGNRVNDGDSMVMRTIASKLSNKDIEAVSSYIQGLH